MTSRPTTAAPILAVLLILALPLGAYVAGYYGLCEHHEVVTTLRAPPQILRIYPAAWHCRLFVPAAWLESKLSHRQVDIIDHADGVNFSFSSSDSGS